MWEDLLPEVKFLIIAFAFFIALRLIAPLITGIFEKFSRRFDRLHIVVIRVHPAINWLIPVISLRLLLNFAPQDLHAFSELTRLITISIILIITYMMAICAVKAVQDIIIKFNPIDKITRASTACVITNESIHQMFNR
jgi:hypothetical protein